MKKKLMAVLGVAAAMCLCFALAGCGGSTASSIEKLSDLEGKVVITQVDSAALEVLDGDMKDLQATFKDGKAQTISDYNNAFMQLESGAVDAVACDLSIAAYQMAAKPDTFKMLDEQLSSEHYAVGFKKDEEGQKLADAITATLVEMDKDGTVKAICDKYREQGISYENWCLDASAAADADTSVAPKDKVLVLGFDKGYPPYGYMGDDGEYTGVDIDLATEACKRLGWELKLEPIDWDAKDALINQGDITCIWNGFTYEGREDAYAFSGQYMINAQVVVVKK